MRHLVVLAACFVCSSALVAQDRGARGAEKAAPQKSVRIVTWNGEQILSNDVMFRWTDFVPPAAAPAGRAGAGRGEGGGGRGEGGGGRGDGAGGRGNAFARAAGAFSTFTQAVGLDRSRDLGRLDRVEVDGDLEFQAKPPARTFALVNGTAYSGGYGGLAFDVAAGWSFVEATDLGATMLKRAADGEIVGRVRVSIQEFGDGQSLRVAFDEKAVEAERLLGTAYVERFESIEADLKEEPIQDDGTRLKRLGRKGVEKSSRAPLHLEGNLVLDGPFVPLVELLARGDEREAILAEARKVLASVRFDRTQPAPVRSDAPLGETAPPALPDDGGGRGGRGGGGRDPMAQMQQVLDGIKPVQDSAFVVDGVYVNAKLGLKTKEALPKPLFFTRADEHGFTAFFRGEDQTVVDLAAVSVAVLWGEPSVKNKQQWLTERYTDGFLGAPQEGEKPTKAKPASLGKLKGSHLEMERAVPFAGESSLDVWFVEDKGRVVVFVISAVGSSGDRTRNIKTIEKWLRSFELAAR
ncbi:MAG: hypothetical protein IT459_08640 [Planctomycetes bacterium]|nr:hypothetical protein [Planctomycetota bacterium]